MNTATLFHGWSRKVHYFGGLYLFLFLWFFSISGLVLNHSKWSVAQFWTQRRESVVARPIVRPSSDADLAIARNLMSQLDIVGEISDIKRSPDAQRVDIQIVKPGRIFQISAQLDSGTAK